MGGVTFFWGKKGPPGVFFGGGNVAGRGLALLVAICIEAFYLREHPFLKPRMQGLKRSRTT